MKERRGKGLRDHVVVVQAGQLLRGSLNRHMITLSCVTKFGSLSAPMPRDGGNFFVGEIAINSEVDYQTGPKGVKSILRRGTKVGEGGDKLVDVVAPTARQVSCRNFPSLGSSEKVPSAGVLSTRILLVPEHWTVVCRAGKLRNGENLIRPSSGSCLSTPNDNSNMLRSGALPDQKDVPGRA